MFGRHRRRSARPDRDRRAKSHRRRPCARGARRLLSARRQAHQDGQAARRRFVRHAVLGRRARLDRERLQGRGSVRHPRDEQGDRASRHRHQRGARQRRHHPRHRRDRKSQRLQQCARHSARGLGGARQALAHARDRLQVLRRQGRRQDLRQGRDSGIVPEIYGSGGQRRQDRSFRRRDRKEAAQRGIAPDQQHRRHHQLCADRDRAADARI